MQVLAIYIGQVAFAQRLAARIESPDPAVRLSKTRYRRSQPRSISADSDGRANLSSRTSRTPVPATLDAARFLGSHQHIAR
jgi:hypothetical protein